MSKDGKAANNLAILVKESDPEKAALLYRRAIDSGDEFYATRNLALLIRGEKHRIMTTDLAAIWRMSW